MSTRSYYEAIAGHYDDIFPLSGITLGFLSELAGDPPVTVTDIACGNAAYSLALAERGHQVTAIDLDVGMLAAAREKVADAGVEERLLLLEGDMQALAELELEPAKLAFCIGNSLVHLPEPAAMSRFLEQARASLLPGGHLVLQIINYDRVIGKGLPGLPTLSNEAAGLMFERMYERVDNPAEPGLLPGRRFTFHTRLTVKGKSWESRIPLYPLLSDELTALLDKVGFRDVQLYGDFRRSPYEPDESYALVAVGAV